jgi:hypothetical protein
MMSRHQPLLAEPETLTVNAECSPAGDYAGNYKFEKAMLEATKCQIHTFDCTYNGKAIHPTRHHYHKWCIGPDSHANSSEDATPDSTSNDGGKIRVYRSWKNITTTLRHQAVHLLKVDIEGYEYPLLAEFKHGDVLPSEISMELHARGDRQIGMKPTTSGQLALVFSHLANLGYAAYSQEVNVLAPGCCSEFTFIRLLER